MSRTQGVDNLAYIGFTSPAAHEWRTFGPEVLGLEVAPDGADGAVRLRMDGAAHRIIIHPGAVNELAYLGWTVSGADALAEQIAVVRAAGFEVRNGDDELAAERHVADLAWFTDTDGFRHELSYGLEAAATPFQPGRPMSGFLTGDGGLGHVVLLVPDIVATEAFYLDVLGFRVSDEVRMGPLFLRFLHCNPRHHTMALGAAPGIVGVHHIMLEVNELDDVGIALDVCRARGLTLAMGFGRHTNDHMTSFYVRSPSGFEVEYGWGGALVDDAEWTIGSYDAISIWGHERPAEPLFPGMIRPVAAKVAPRAVPA